MYCDYTFTAQEFTILISLSTNHWYKIFRRYNIDTRLACYFVMTSLFSKQNADQCGGPIVVGVLRQEELA
jgi:hypothetical protein